MKKLRKALFIAVLISAAPLLAVPGDPGLEENQSAEESSGGKETENGKEKQNDHSTPAGPAQTQTQAPQNQPAPGAPAQNGEDQKKKRYPYFQYDYVRFPYEDRSNVFLLDADEKKSIMDKFQWRLMFWTSGNYFNNSDLRTLNNSNQTSIDKTDDRMSFIVGGIDLDTFFPIHQMLDLRVNLWRVGFWGHDQFSGRDTNNDLKYTRNGANTVNFNNLYFDVHFRDPQPRDKLDLRVGRQPFKVGGEIEREHLLYSYLDAITLRWYSKFGKLDLLLLDVWASGSYTQDVYFVQYISYDDTKVKGFNGDVNTLRNGFVYAFPFIGGSEYYNETHLEARAFYFFARYGGLADGGSDRTNKGTTGNFADNDYSFMRGARLNGGIGGKFRAQLTYAESFGLDRKRQGIDFRNRDVDTAGKAWQLETEIALFARMFLIRPSLFWSQGGRYYGDGYQYSHGFTGFKGMRGGGMLTDLNWGLYPAAYIDDDGIDDTPFEKTRKSGTYQRHLGISLGKPGSFYFRMDWYRLDDTNSVGIFGNNGPGFTSILRNKYQGPSVYEQQAMIEVYKIYYPTAATLLSAYRRFGAPIGEEIDIGFDWSILKNWSMWFTVGVFKPMRYFATTGLIQGAPEGNTRFTGMQLGTSFFF